MNLRPISNRIVVQPIGPETELKSGIILPDNPRQKPRKGKVLAIGPGKITSKGIMKVEDVVEGDIVLFAPYAGNDFEFDSVENGRSKVKILVPEDLLAVITEDQE